MSTAPTAILSISPQASNRHRTRKRVLTPKTPPKSPFQQVFEAAKHHAGEDVIVFFRLENGIFAAFNDDAAAVGAAIGVYPMRRDPSAPLTILLADPGRYRVALYCAGLRFSIMEQAAA